jgi:hypothetical protein
MLLGEEGETVRTVMADSLGLFTLVAPGPGRYSVYAEALGYFSFVDGPLEFAAGQVYQAQIHLELNPIQIDPLEVSAQPLNTWLEMAGFYERKELNRGHFIDRAEIEEKKPHSMTDLFRGGTSFRVIPTQVAGSTGGYTVVSRRSIRLQGVGNCGPMVYLDGIRVGRTYGDGGATPLDQLLHPDEVEAVEAYSGISQVPERWRDSTASCGVILIWTRKGQGGNDASMFSPTGPPARPGLE